MDPVTIFLHGNAILIEKDLVSRDIVIDRISKDDIIPDEFKQAMYEMYYYLYIGEYDAFYNSLARVSNAANNVYVEQQEDMYIDLDHLEVTPWQL